VISPRHARRAWLALLALGDGGRTWQQVASTRAGVAASFGTPANFEFVSVREGYAVGMTEAGKPPPDSDLGSFADLYRTDDGGSSGQRFGPAMAGPHAAGLPTVIGGAIDVPSCASRPAPGRSSSGPGAGQATPNGIWPPRWR